VTVVGLHSGDDAAEGALGDDDGADDQIDLWLEIPRNT
jgi:hypothetical protein